MSTKSQRLRAILLLVSLELGFLAVLIHLFQIQCLNSNKEDQPLVEPLWTWVKRGNIYGRHYYELASNRDMLSVWADPQQFSPARRARAAQVLAPLLDMAPEEILGLLSKDRGFVWLKRKMDYAQLEPLKTALRKEKVRGIRFKREQKRFYPNGDLVPHVIGFANYDNKGIDGIERSYDDLMMSYEKVTYVHQDGLSRPTDPRDIKDNGPDFSNSVVLTIDEMIQYAADVALTQACEKWQARSGSAIVMNPKTGEVLAMANYPSLDLNDYGRTQEFKKRNRAIWFAYEPGSGFKAFTMAAALSENVVTPETLINCENGRYNYHGDIIRDTHPSGVISATDILVRSSNIGIAKISEKLGIQRLGDYLQAFGFGASTGIDLPYERRGNISALKRWSDEGAGFIGFGHGITVTPLQMLTAMNAIANKGILMKPYVALEVRDGEGRVLQRMQPTEVRRVLSVNTAEQVVRMLVKAVQDGGNKEAQVPGFKVAGKTGTAQKADAGGYSDEKYVSSFIGFLPADNPKISVIVVIDEPQGEHLGRKVAAPVFQQIAVRTIELLTVSSQLAYSRSGNESLSQ